MKPESKTAKKAKAKAARVSHSSALQIPPILLETDTPATPVAAGPGKRYALGPPERVVFGDRIGEQKELPESYATGRLFLTACDPHRLHVAWDLTSEQQKEYNSLSTDGHLVVRLYVDSFDGELFHEVRLLPEARSSFFPAARGGTTYLAELGYRDRAGDWKRISTSGPAPTPPDDLSADTSVQFATIPPETSFEKVLEIISSAVGLDVPFEEAILQLRAQGHRALPPAAARFLPEFWASVQERALAELLSMESVRQTWMGSLEIPELIQGHRPGKVPVVQAGGISPMKIVPHPSPPVGGVSSVSVPSQEAGEKKAFWFSINAELVIYGATEPDAQLAVGGRFIKLRPDGTFSLRFALPDGDYKLPALAISADGEDARLAVLHFHRSTEYTGEVGVQAPDPKLKTPDAAHIG